MKRKKLTVVVDSREKQPLVFPSRMEWTDTRWRRHLLDIETETRTVDAGDYYIDGYEDIIRIERKGSISEVRNNLIGADKRRALSALGRFQKSCKYPYLYIDESLIGFNRKSQYVQFPDGVQDFLFRELAARGISLLWLPDQSSMLGKRLIGETLLRIMWAHIQIERKD